VRRTEDCLTHKAIWMTTATTTSPNSRGKEHGGATQTSSRGASAPGTYTHTSRPQEHREVMRMNGADEPGERVAACREAGEGHAEGAPLGKLASSWSAGSDRRRPEDGDKEPWTVEMRRRRENSRKHTHGRRIRTLRVYGGSVRLPALAVRPCIICARGSW
jgi:hypothetical protein